MKLTTMQDLGGCRAVLASVDAVNRLADQFRQIKSQLEDPGEDNYVANPKPDGYRSVHFVVRFRSKNTAYLHLPSRRIEVQIRSKLQHEWATALETIDLFTEQTLKGGGGEAMWKRFFILTSDMIALKEGCPRVPGSIDDPIELVSQVRLMWDKLRIPERLSAWMTTVQLQIPQEHGTNAMYLIETDADKKTTGVKAFLAENVTQAFSEYKRAELRNHDFPSRSAVLVAARSVDELRAAYPSYYGNTQAFLDVVKGELLADRPESGR